MKTVIFSLFIVLVLFFLFKDLIKVFILNNIIVSRGILVPDCFWYTISQKLVKDGSGIDLFYKLKKREGDVPKTFMFGYKTHIITKKSHIKTILDNSPYPFGPGKLKFTFFKSFMPDNVGVSQKCPWRKRRVLNEKVLDTDNIPQHNEKYNKDTNNQIKSHLLKDKIVYSDFQTISKNIAGLIIFNTTEIHPDVFNIFSEANTVMAFYTDYSIDKEVLKNYNNYLESHIANPLADSFVELCVENESSEYEIKQQIPHFIFPVVGLYLTTIPRLLLILSNHPKKFQKLVDEIKNKNKLGNLSGKEIYNLVYLRKCVLEMLRLNNPVVTTFRTAEKDLKLDSHKFKKGDQLLILNNPVLRNPDFFPEPDKYIPERWNKEMEKSYFAISFNQGPQICPGKEFAIYLVQIFIVNFVTETGILNDINKLKTERINTDKIGQIINTCNLEFKIKP